MHWQSFTVTPLLPHNTHAQTHQEGHEFFIKHAARYRKLIPGVRGPRRVYPVLSGRPIRTQRATSDNEEHIKSPVSIIHSCLAIARCAACAACAARSARRNRAIESGAVVIYTGPHAPRGQRDAVSAFASTQGTLQRILLISLDCNLIVLCVKLNIFCCCQQC